MGDLGLHREKTYFVPMTRKHLSRAWLLAALLLASCGGGSAPVWKGSAGNVLLTDQTGYNNTPPAQMWVGFNSPGAFQDLRNSLVNQQVVMIYGTVVNDSAQPFGFYLDPNSTRLSSNAIPELVQPMRSVGENLGRWQGQGVTLYVRVAQIE